MFAFDKLFDFNHDDHLDVFERAVQFQAMDEWDREASSGSYGDSGLTGYGDNDDADVFAEAGLDYDELEFMDPIKRRGVLEDAGLNPDEFDF